MVGLETAWAQSVVACSLPLQAEVEELFDVVDVERRGQISREELAAGLIDWKVGLQGALAAPWLPAAPVEQADVI